jgi:hypothetical protein
VVPVILKHNFGEEIITCPGINYLIQPSACTGAIYRPAVSISAE